MQKHTPTLTHDELTAVRKNLQRNGLEVDNEFIRETWHPVYRRFFLQQSLARAYDCKKGYYLYHTGHENEVRVRILLKSRVKKSYCTHAFYSRWSA